MSSTSLNPPRGAERMLQYALVLGLLLLLLLSFAGTGGFNDAYASSADPVAQAARRTALWAATLRSLAVGALATLVAMALGLPAGWVLAHSRHRWRWWLLPLCALPLILPASVAVSGWVQLLAPADAASRFKGTIPGFPPESRGTLFSIWGAALVLGLNLWPVVAFEAWPAFRRACNETYDAALLSTTRANAFFKIVVPQAAGELCAAALLVFLLASNDFSVTSLLLVRTLPTEIHDALMLGKYDTAAWSALPLLVLVVLLALLPGRLHRPRPFTPVMPGSAASPVWATVLTTGAVLLSFGLPMFACARGALAGGQPMGSVFTAGVDALGVSLRLAAAAAFLSVLAGIVRVLIWPQTHTAALNWLALLLLAAPGSFIAAALLGVQLKLETLFGGVPLSALILGLGNALRFVYVPLRLVEEGLAAIDPQLHDAAALAGQHKLARAASIALPLVATHLAAAAALVFVFVLGEVPLAHKLAPPGVVPATVWLFQQQHMGYDEAVFGLSLLLGCCSAGILGISVVTLKLLAGSGKGPA